MSRAAKRLQRVATHRPAQRRRRFRHDTLTACDLFSGFGGLTEGIRRAGFDTIMAANHNQYKVDVHERNHPYAEHWIADLVDKESSDYHSAADLPAADLLVAGVSCFAAGSLVLTRRGLVPIEDVSTDDEVWTHRSRWRPVTHTSAVERPAITVNATTPITCTPDHPFWAADAERAYQTRRKYQPLEGAACLECGGGVPQFKENTARLFCSRKCSQADASRRALPVLGTPREVRADELAGVWVGSPILTDAGAELPAAPDLGPITADNAWVLGRWVGDGWVARRPERDNVWSRVTICASHAEADELGAELRERTNLPWNSTEQRTTNTFHVNRQGLAAFIVEHFGHGAEGKRIPAWLLFAPAEIRKAFVEGYLSADGHTSRGGLRVQAATVSKQLAVGLRLLLTSLDYYASTLLQRVPTECVIEGRTVRQRPRWVVTGYLREERRPKHRDVDGFRWGKARGTVSPGETVTVYNMTVEEDHTYVVDGVIVHNCTNHSPANTKKAYEQGLTLFNMNDPDYEAAVTRSERDRATANCVLHYAARHRPRMILVECTTQLSSWGVAVPGKKKVGDGRTYRWWLKQFDLLGYSHKVLYLNTQFFGVPQSRDRGFWVFWLKELPAPDLDHRPIAWCDRCHKVVESRWTWKTGLTPTGKVAYGEQYNYTCPSCRREVVPTMAPSISALDLTDLGVRIGDKPLKRFVDKETGEVIMSPMAPATMARAERCRQRFPEFPAVLMPAKAVHGTEKHPWKPMATQTSQQETSLLSTGAVMVAAGNTYERPGSDCRSRDLSEPLWSQTATSTTGLVTPPVAVTGMVTVGHRHNGDGKHISVPMDTVTATPEKAVFLAVNNFQGAPRGVEQPLPTQPGSETLSLLSAGVVPFRKHTVPTGHSESMPAVTSDQIPGLLTAAGTIKNNGSIGEAQYRAHPVTDPLGTVVGSGAHQSLLTAGWFKQNGVAADATASHPVLDPLGTLTSRDTTGVLMAEWRDVLSQIALEDCYFRMLREYEIGRGCGFDTTFPGQHEGTFQVWGTARQQVDGYGNAVTPQVGEWIATRLREALHRTESVA
jgi:DNA (cytosine-5)-methyltransferase 1